AQARHATQPRHGMRRLAWVVVLAAGVSPALAAQGSTAELLGQAHQFYERLEVERALPLLRQIVSPNWPFEVTPDQRVDAYKYLGAGPPLSFLQRTVDGVREIGWDGLLGVRRLAPAGRYTLAVV